MTGYLRRNGTRRRRGSTSALRVSRYAEAPLRDGLPVHLHLGTTDTVARAAVLGSREIAPGETGFVQLDLEHPVGALCGDRAVLRDHAARHTLAGGRVVDPFAPRRGRRQPARLAVLEALATADPAQALARLLAVDGVVDLAQFALVAQPGAERARSIDRGGRVSARRTGARPGRGDPGAAGSRWATKSSTRSAPGIGRSPTRSGPAGRP